MIADDHAPNPAAQPSQPPCPPAPIPPLTWRGHVSRHLQYLYFLRFPLLIALVLPVLMGLDCADKTTTITRGIFTLHGEWQAINAAFFIASLHMAILISIRNIVINGDERFKSPCPQWLCKTLTNVRPHTVWAILAAVHLPTVLELARLASLAREEQETFTVLPGGTGTPGHIVPYFAIGVAASFVFWYLVSLFYYWTYRQSMGRRDPSALLFPHALFGDVGNAVPPRLGSGLNRLLLRWLPISCSGYAADVHGPLYELHFLSVVSLIGTFLLYFFLYALTAPVPGPARQVSAQVAAIVLAGFSLWGLVRNQPTPETGVQEHSHWGPRVKLFFLFFTCFIAAVFVYSVCKDRDFIKLAFAFPAIASILVVLTFFLWALSTLSFFFDRYRIPVLLSAVFLIFLPKVIGSSDLEHFFEVEGLPHPLASIPTPADALAGRSPDLAEPAIIVTASGGGIQAAFWTSQIMARLEADFANNPDLLKPNPQAAQATPYTFHDHLLLASGVSGGSLGLMPYLLEYTAPDGAEFPNADALRARLTNPSRCSSLEAVAWGLSYYDLDRLLLTYGRSGSRPADGDFWPVDTDRSWALGQAFNRNLNEYHCDTLQKTYDDLLQQERTRPRNPALPALPDALPALNNGNSFTLSEAATRLQDHRMPAFTFNTTVAETGGRFLLSNYHVPPMNDPQRATSDFLPAESFLHAYAQDASAVSPPAYADLALSTAARLSATFPYISSAARIHRHFSPHAFHFLDGGYFDNDGTASVIEFLHSALGCRVGDQGCPVPTPPTQPPLAQPSPRNILLIEIRDGGDLQPLDNQDDLKNQSAKDVKDWSTKDQLTGPLLGMWNAGHTSVSRRNRRELCLLEKAYADRLHLHHVVFTIPRDEHRIDPLNWHLTQRQRKYIEACAGPALPNLTCRESTTNKEVQAAISWVVEMRRDLKEVNEEEADVCHTAPRPK